MIMENLREVVLKRGGLLFLFTSLSLFLLTSPSPGSLEWLAPEEMEKRGEGEGGRGSEKADVWSLGCVLLQLATCASMDVSYHQLLSWRKELFLREVERY